MPPLRRPLRATCRFGQASQRLLPAQVTGFDWCAVQVTPRALPPLSTWNGQHGHDLDGIAREYGKVRMLVEEPGGGIVRIRAYNRECAHVIARIVDPTLRDLLGF